MKNDSPSSIAISVLPTPADLFRYKIFNTFFSGHGALRLILSAVLIAASFILRPMLGAAVSAALLVLGLLNPVVSPLLMWIQSNKQYSPGPKTIFVGRTKSKFMFQSVITKAPLHQRIFTRDSPISTA